MSQNGNLYFSDERSLFRYANKNLKRIWTSSQQENNNDRVVGLVPGKEDSVFFATTFGGIYAIAKSSIMKIAGDNYVAAALIRHKDQLYYLTTCGIYKFYASARYLEKISEVPEDVNSKYKS